MASEVAGEVLVINDQDVKCPRVEQNLGSEYVFYTEVASSIGLQLKQLFLSTPAQGRVSEVQFDGMCKVKFSATGEEIGGRIALAQCYSGKYYSVVIRFTHENQKCSPHGVLKKETCPLLCSPDSKSKFLFPNNILSDFILHALSEHAKDLHGLIVVSAPTKSGKTELTQAICLNHVLGSVRKGDKPHLVSFEDPIEKWIYYEGKETSAKSFQEKPDNSLDYGFCFTPRNASGGESKRDVMGLAEATNIALRQTPKIFYIGEIRNRDDWKTTLEFANTGHLVVATCHAASVVETFQKILTAVEAQTPFERGVVASRTLAVINPKVFRLKENSKLEDSPSEVYASVPQIWIRTKQTIAAMVADGLASIIPNGGAILSRSQAVRQIGKLPSCNDIAREKRELLQQAFSECLGLDFRE